MGNALGNLFTDIANSIRGGLGGIGKMSPSAFPSWINELVAMIGSGEDSGGSGDSSSSDSLQFARGTCSVSEDGTQVTVEHGLGCMPDLIIFQLPQIFSGDGTVEDVAGKIPLVAAWGIKSTFDCSIHSGKVTSVYGLTSPLGIDDMSEAGAAGGYIYCPDEETFRVGATGDGNSKLYAGNNYQWLAISGIGSGAGGSSADVRYVTFMSYDGLVEYGKKAVAVGDDSADPIVRGVFDTPTRESDAQYNYTFYGWATEPNGAADSDWNKAITEDKTVYSNFAAAVRYYTITYYDSDGTTVLKTESLAYGAMPSYKPTKENVMFGGWTTDAVEVTGDASYIAVWLEKITFANGTWDKIVEICDAGMANECFSVGDTKQLTLSDGKTFTVEIVGINHDTLFTGGTAPLSIVVKNGPLYTSSITQAVGSNWLTEGIRAEVQGYLSLFPEELKAAIKQVNKKTMLGKEKNNYTSTTSVESLWLLSRGELFTNGTYITDGPAYTHFSNDASNRIRYKNGTAVQYILRSTVSAWNKYWDTVGADGYQGGTAQGNTITGNIVFGFCI